jgi:signal transduction histidine kinase/CheY-like chemotaxis protein
MKIGFLQPVEAASRRSSELETELNDLSRETLTDTTVAVLGVDLLWFFVGGMTWPVELGARIWLSSGILIALLGATLWLIPRHIKLARLALLVSLTTGILINLAFFQQPGIGFLLALLPLVGLTIAGWPVGVLMELLVAFCVLVPLRGLLAPDGAGLLVGIIGGGAFTVLIGYLTRRTLLFVTERSLVSYAEARTNMEEAREHRGKLVKALKEVDLAYYRLERANSALMIASKAAEQAEQFKAEFVTTVSHEMRTPLNLIIGFIEVIMTSPESYSGVDLPPVYRSDLNAIYRSARHVLELVDDVIDMARLDAGRLGMTYALVPLQEVMGEAAGMVRDYTNTKGLGLELHIAEGLPDLWIDRLRIRQVLLNLLVNAARFTDRGKITLSADSKDDLVEIKVSDTGKGISTEELPHVFDEFQTSGPPETTWHSGSGLGLPISKKIVEVHGGKMGVESSYGQGSTFWLTLPVRLESDGKEGKNRRPKPAYIYRPADLADPVVPAVVVDFNDSRAQALFQRQMEDFQIHKTDNLAEALNLAEQYEALAVITEHDLDVLPAGSKRLFIRCPIPSGRHSAEVLGAQDLLVKPVTGELLWATIERLGITPHSALVADDDQNITRLFRRILRGGSMRGGSMRTPIPNDQIVEAHNGEEALAAMRQHHPELVLLDLEMPGMDGLAVLAQKDAEPELKDIPVIVITGHEEKSLEYDLQGKIEVDRPAGFRPSEAIQAVNALIKSLSPQYNWPGSNAPAPRSRPAETRAWEDTPPPPV